MARKVYLEVKVKLILNLEEGISIQKVMEEIDYRFNSGEDFDVLETEILDCEVTDSK